MASASEISPPRSANARSNEMWFVQKLKKLCGLTFMGSTLSTSNQAFLRSRLASAISAADCDVEYRNVCNRPLHLVRQGVKDRFKALAAADERGRRRPTQTC